MEIKPPSVVPTNPTRADAAAAGIGFAIGFAVDVFLFPAGVPPGTTAGVFAVGAVGLKNGMQQFISGRRSPDAPPGISSAKQAELAERHHGIQSYLSRHKYDDLAKTLMSEYELWRSGVSTDTEFEEAMHKRAVEIRKRRDLPPPS